ncbi:DUF2207 domain-containing protein [Flavihumibacter rivuli]|uniref:DUF2207 domain-containing protein n=1 Tax=Flavihumibacter rivuli TaxID=2838156 RepID=UPI001BDED5C5|nr:DUF2207 domain-containing protein [Flavihumibacter rivuli]ULQ57716.1 DUF2207 domain-containing protein [Flavihumibacter rivuli]
MHLWRRLFFIVKLCCCYSINQAQQEWLTPNAARFISQKQVDSIFFEQALPLANSHRISATQFKSSLANMGDRVNLVLQATLLNPFYKLDAQYRNLSPGGKAWEQGRDAYLLAVKNGIARALENPHAFYPLFSFDPSDRILHFSSNITVQKNGELLVTEDITIYNGNGDEGIRGDPGSLPSQNNDIQRGIVRDFPTKYRDKKGFWTRTGFKLKALYKNGQPEHYITESLENGIRIKAGSEEVILDTGVYHYRIEYSTNRQLIFHPDKDELYWNVNGNGWVFTADSITCRISFPEGASILEWACYTGPQGATERNCTGIKENAHTILFNGTNRFNAYEGLTVAAAIEKGVLLAPTSSDNTFNFLGSNYIIPLLGALGLLLLGSYFFIWNKKGRDPKKGTIYPQFDPPAGFSPADCGYILDQQYGSHLFAAALVDFAVHGELEIDVSQTGSLFASTTYSFRQSARNRADQSVDDGRYGFRVAELYGEKIKKGTFNSTIKRLDGQLSRTLSEKFTRGSKRSAKATEMFALNTQFGCAGWIVVILSLAATIFFLVTNFSKTLLIIAGSIWLFMFIVHLVFSRIMSAYTVKGRETADHILGFRMYLGQAEQHYYQQLTPPEKTLELFERYLPYAIALKVENEWAGQFQSILLNAIDQGYRPAYYHTVGGFSRGFNMGDLSKGVSSGLSSTISSASTPPSSSSGGSSGGGSSGGGGGGGGGGGW